MKSDITRQNWDDLSHGIRNMLQCSKQFLSEFSLRCRNIDELLMDISAGKDMLDWTAPVKNPVIRMDEMGDGHFGASRGARIHRGTDYLTTPGDPVFMTLKGARVKREIIPYFDCPTLTGVVLANEQCINILFYVEPIQSLIGKEVSQGQLIGHSQDVRTRYGDKMLPHIHSEKIIV
jgi:hypothetical protein